MSIPNYAARHESQYEWIQIGFLSAIEAALAVDERDNASVAAFSESVSGVMTDGAGKINVLSVAHGLTTNDFVTIVANQSYSGRLFTTAGGGAAVNVSAPAHGLLAGDYAVITGTDDYNGTYAITVVDVNNFTFVDTFVSAQRGTWRKHNYSGIHQIIKVDADNFTFVDTYRNDQVNLWRAYKTVIWLPDDGTVGAEIRFRTNGTNNDTFVIEVYASRGADYYTHVGTLTCIQGQQEWSGGAFVDDITETGDFWSELSVQSVTDEIGRVYLNTKGYDRFLFLSPDMLDDDIETVFIDIVRRDLGWTP